jgi:hypothetical protein
MTAYHLRERSTPTNSVREAKEERRKVLAGVAHRRKLMYKQYNIRKTLAYYQRRKNSPDFD